MDKLIKIFLSLFGGYLVFIFGEASMVFYCLVLLTFLDIITGLMKAYANRNISSEAMRKGLVRKIFIYIMICVGNIMDKLLNIEVSIRDICIMYYIIEELLSVIENLGSYIDYPEIIKKGLEQLKTKAKNAEG